MRMLLHDKITQILANFGHSSEASGDIFDDMIKYYSKQMDNFHISNKYE